MSKNLYLFYYTLTDTLQFMHRPSRLFDETVYRFHWMRVNMNHLSRLTTTRSIEMRALLLLLIHAPFILKRDTMQNHYRLLLVPLLLVLFLMGFSYATSKRLYRKTSSNHGWRSFTISLCVCHTSKTLHIVGAAAATAVVHVYFTTVCLTAHALIVK